MYSVEKWNSTTNILPDLTGNKRENANNIDYNVNKVNNLLFNNQDKIIKDITTAIENSNNTKEEKESSK